MRIKILGIDMAFVANWKLLGFYVFFLPLFLGLGYWQLDRAAAKADLERSYEHSIRGDAAPLASVISAPSFQKVELLGRFDTERHFLLDNRTYRGVAGYEVISLLRLQDPVYISGSTTKRYADHVWVARGWVPAGAQRGVLPDILTPSGEVRLHVILDPVSADAFVLKDLPYPDAWPKVIQRVDFTRMQQVLSDSWSTIEVMPFLMRLRPESPGSFQLIWNPIVMPSEKHLGYALQWFSMSAALTILYLFVSFKRVEHH